MHGDVEWTTNIFAADHGKGQIVVKVLKGITEIVDRTFGHQLLPEFALHIEGVGDAATRDVDVELHLLALRGLDFILLDFHLIGEGLLETLLVVDDALRGLHGKRRQKHHQQY